MQGKQYFQSTVKLILKYRVLYLVGALALFGLQHYLYSGDFLTPVSRADVDSFSDVLHKKEVRVDTLLEELATQVGQRPVYRQFNYLWQTYDQLLEKEGLVLYISENDTIQYWSSHKVPIPTTSQLNSGNPVILHLGNGIYEVRKLDYNDKQYFGLILIKREYAFENDYLVNAFQNDFSLPDAGNIELDNESEHKVLSKDGVPLFGLSFNGRSKPPTWKYAALVLLAIGGTCMLFLFLHFATRSLARYIGRVPALILFIGIVIGLRIWSIEILFPSLFLDLDLFNPAYYADSYLFPSLGDLLINVLLLLLCSWYVHAMYQNPFKKKKPSAFTGLMIAFVLLFLLHGWSMINTSIIKGLIKNSSINFEINNLFSLDWYSYMGILIVSLLMLSYFVLANKLVEVIVKSGIAVRQFIVVFMAFTIAYIIVSHKLGIVDLILVCWPTGVLLVLGFVHYRSSSRYTFSTVIVLLGILSFFASHTLAKFTIQKEKEDRMVFAEKLSSDEDIVAEWEYPSLEGKLKKVIRNLPFDSLNKFSKNQFDKDIQQKCFTGYWDKYEVKTYIFGPDSIELGNADQVRVNFNRMERTIELFGASSELSPNLIYIQNPSQKLSYLIKLPLYGLYSSSKPIGFLFFELTSKLIPEELGFPALLLDNNSRKIDDLSNYSYARYVDKKLITSSGDYPYPLTQRIFESLKGERPYFDFDGYNHLFYNVNNQFSVDNQILIVLSKPTETILGQFTAFSYLFAFFSIMLLIVLFFRNFPEGLRIETLQLKTKIQLLIVFVLLVSLILFVVGTRYYIEQQYTEKNYNLISEKINSVQIEVKNKLGKQAYLDETLVDEMTKYLTKFSGVFFTDINLYSLEGDLLASSRSKIFDEGLISRKMSPEAYVELGINEKSKFIFEEEIGSMRYLSAYVPFRNNDDQILAYLNLPYFAKQNELEKEISSFLVSIINIFVLLFGFSIVAALFVSNWITKPLRLLQENLARVQLGRKNEPLVYKGSDEIGSLVAEYNKMVSELEYNTLLLARSERESAWREMAKQVAHEIKNPLTPIKLRAQHMQMSFNPSDPEATERMKSFTDMLIEQIDTLTGIANEFSNFAKMPKAQEGELDIALLLTSSVELYRDAADCEVSYQSELEDDQFVIADKDQMVRVFNNLIKNAIQAIPDTQEGKVQVILERIENHYKVEVRDNGSGIAKEQIDKIFAPNFTTKSTGMGLGLAMVKQIVENAGGTVEFKTKLNVGTSFYVNLPALHKEEVE